MRDWRFWIPLIAAFSGARLNEIAQLAIADITSIDDIPVLRICDEGTDQSVKTPNSVRLIPIHSMLLELGFLQFVAAARNDGKTALFETINLDVDGRRSTHAGRTFRKLLVRLKVKDDGERGGIHRLRHSAIDRLRLAGHADHEFAPVLGHESGMATMTGKYGEGAQLSIRRRQQLIESIRYAGLDVDALRP